MKNTWKKIRSIHLSVIKLLIEKGADVIPPGKGNLSMVKYIVESGADVSNLTMVRFIIESGADANSQRAPSAITCL